MFTFLSWEVIFMKRIMKPGILMCSVLAQCALALACLTANSTCFFLSYQPDEPACLREMMAHRKEK